MLFLWYGIFSERFEKVLGSILCILLGLSQGVFIWICRKSLYAILWGIVLGIIFFKMAGVLFQDLKNMKEREEQDELYNMYKKRRERNKNGISRN